MTDYFVALIMMATYCDTVNDHEDKMMGMSFPSIMTNIHNILNTDTQ